MNYRSRREVTFLLLDGRRVVISKNRGTGYSVEVWARVEKRDTLESRFASDYKTDDGKISTYKEVMKKTLSKTLYNIEGAKDVYIRALD